MKKEEPAMLNKKIKGFLAVALLSSITLVGCSKEVIAKPADYKDEVVTFTGDEGEVYHNIRSIIEDAYREGTLASAVSDKILYQYAVSIFGRYNKVAEPKTMEGTTLKQAYVAYKNGDPAGVCAKFIDEHKAYWSLNEKGEREKDDREKERVAARYEAIEERIAKSFHGDIEGGSYSERGLFSEKKYLASLKSQLKHVADPYLDATEKYEDIVITPDVKEEEVFDNYLHRANYQAAESYALDKDENANPVVSYVEDEIIPSIYRSLLVEQYLMDESYNTLGRSYARKVNVLTISPNSNNDKAADYLMKYFVREKISKGVTIDLAEFKKVSNAMKGLLDTTGKNEYLEAVNAVTEYANAFPYETFTGYDGETYNYYVGTDFGDMMAKFSKIKKDINTTDSSAESEFTGSYAYTADIGKAIKEREIMGKDYTTDGWYVKDGGLSELPDSIKTRLFNIGVANVLDQKEEDAKKLDRFDGTSYVDHAPEGESKLVARINGKYYLKVAEKQSDATLKDDILFNEGGKYYVIQIEEAVSTSKLDKSNDTTYEKKEKEDILLNVARVVGNNDKYQTLSTKHWLEQAAIKYHDTTIYEYFKTNYPELF